MTNKVTSSANANADEPSLAQMRRLRGLLYLSAILLIVGLIAPMMTISKFVVVRSSFSVLSGIFELLKNGQILLFLVIGGFSVVMPVFKLWVLFRLTDSSARSGERVRYYLRLLHEHGRWAMLDVLVVALLVVTVKLGAIASVQVHYGLFSFGAAAVLSMYVTGKVVRLPHLECGG